MYFCVTLLTQFIIKRVDKLLETPDTMKYNSAQTTAPTMSKKLQQKLNNRVSWRAELLQDCCIKQSEYLMSCQLCVLFILSHVLGHKTSRLHNFHIPLDYSLHVSTHHHGQGAYSPPWTWRKTADKCIVGGLLKIDNTYNLQKTSPRQKVWAISLHFTTIDRKEQIIPVCKGQEQYKI